MLTRRTLLSAAPASAALILPAPAAPTTPTFPPLWEHMEAAAKALEFYTGEQFVGIVFAGETPPMLLDAELYHDAMAAGAAARAKPTPATPDELIAAIAAYRAGVAAYNDHPVVASYTATQDEFAAAVAETFGPPQDVLSGWGEPAQTLEAAVAALRLARDENIAYGGSHSAVLDAMLDAAVAYFDKEAANA